MKCNSIWQACLAVFVAFAFSTAVAPAFLVSAGSPVDEQTLEVARLLQCPVCNGLSVADSPAPLAQQMRGIIRQKLEQGESKEQILRFFVERYGEAILWDPPKHGFSLLIWLMPLIALAGGALLVGSFLWRGTHAKRREGVGERDGTGDAGDDDLDGYGSLIEQRLQQEQGL